MAGAQGFELCIPPRKAVLALSWSGVAVDKDPCHPSVQLWRYDLDIRLRAIDSRATLLCLVDSALEHNLEPAIDVAEHRYGSGVGAVGAGVLWRCVDSSPIALFKYSVAK